MGVTTTGAGEDTDDEEPESLPVSLGVGEGEARAGAHCAGAERDGAWIGETAAGVVLLVAMVVRCVAAAEGLATAGGSDVRAWDAAAAAMFTLVSGAADLGQRCREDKEA